MHASDPVGHLLRDTRLLRSQLCRREPPAMSTRDRDKEWKPMTVCLVLTCLAESLPEWKPQGTTCTMARFPRAPNLLLRTYHPGIARLPLTKESSIGNQREWRTLECSPGIIRKGPALVLRGRVLGGVTVGMSRRDDLCWDLL